MSGCCSLTHTKESPEYPGRFKWGFKCRKCLEIQFEEEAKKQGCVLVGAGRNKDNRTYLLPCGHKKEVALGQMRTGNFRCQECMEAKHAEEAELHGCKLLGEGKSALYRTYLLPCGHKQETQTSHIRRGTFRCQTCEDYYYTQPSNVYLLHIKVGADEWLKLGFSRLVDNRINNYGLPSDAIVSTLANLPFETGLEAVNFEKAVHKKYKRKRLRPKDMIHFHARGGSTECYPVRMVETLLAEFRSQK